MLSIGRLGPDGGRYYISQVAAGREDYYIGAGEAPGVWMGSGLDRLGLSGQVDPEHFTRVLAGQHPATGEPLVAVADGRVQGLDLTFSAPKSVSLLWALHPDPAVRRAVADAHDQAVADAIAFLGSDALRARRGHNGLQRIATSGLIAAGFGHRASRAGDPQLHTHLVAANLVFGADGRWSAVDTRAVYRHARTAGFIYQARLRHQLTRLVGVEWGPVRSGQADIAGIDRAWLEAFSTRRADILDALAERGLSTANAARVATLDTRPAKADPETAVGLFERWQTQAHTLGVDVAGLAGPGREPTAPAGLVEHLTGPGGLTAGASTFDRRQLLTALAGAHPDGATLEQLETLASVVTGRAATVELTAPGTDNPARRWTTVDLLAVEADLMRLADRAALARVGVADTRTVRAALEVRPQLTGEQQELVEGICTTPAGVCCVVGKAGTGKTFTLDAARAAWTRSGVAVFGAALSARAAAELQAGAGIPSTTLARLLAELDTPEGRPGRGSVIVVDEAGMVGSRQLHRLATSAARHGWKVVLAGDPRQLPEIDSGGAFAALTSRAPTWTLSVNVRQVEGWERAALDQLRDHHPAPAVAAYQTAGRVTIADTAGQLRQAMVADWHTARLEGRTAIMLAGRRSEVDELNRAAQAVRVAVGELDPATAVEVGGRVFMAGDEILCGRNDRRAGLTNGSRLTLQAIHPDSHLDTHDRDGRTVHIPWHYIEAGHLSLGYAATIHKAQGMTTDQAFLLGDDRLFAEAGYVGLSRARESNRLYVIAQPSPHHTSRGRNDIAHLIAALGVSQAQQLSTSHAHPHPDLADLPLGQLVRQQQQLVQQIRSDMPPDPTTALTRLGETRQALDAAPPDARWVPATRARLETDARHLAEQLQQRQEWAAGHRRHGQTLAQLTATIDARLNLLTRQTVLDPAPELVALIGPPPDNPTRRAGWEQTAGRIAAWSQITATPIADLPAAPAPPGYPERSWWAQARTALEQHHLQLDRYHDKGFHL